MAQKRKLQLLEEADNEEAETRADNDNGNPENTQQLQAYPSPITNPKEMTPDNSVSQIAQQPTLAEYERADTWRNPRNEDMQEPANSTTDHPTPQAPTSSGQRIPQGPISRTPTDRPGAARAPRSRRAVPPSDPHDRVPAGFVFPSVAQTIGSGMGSGRNWLVVQDGVDEPVLRAPLRINRCKKDSRPGQGSQYPRANAVIPAGLTLRQICQLWPRHVWGEMLRIMMSEQWDARRIWGLLPAEMRNNARSRPWNYIQAGMGRENDMMDREETGIPRVKVKRERSADLQTPAAATYWAEDDLGVDQVVDIARQDRELGLETQRAVLWAIYGGGTRADAERFWQNRHTAWARGILNAYEAESGQRMPTRQPVEMLQVVWQFRNPRQSGEPLVDYNARGYWHAWRDYAAAVQELVEELQDELEALVGGGEGEDAVEMEEVEDED